MDTIAIVLVVIFLIGGGIATLRNGRIRATRHSVVEGTPARVIGWLLLLTIPLTFVSYRLLPVLLAAVGESVNPAGIGPLLAFCLPLVACPLIAIAIGFATAQRVQPEPAPSRPVPGSVGRAVSPLTPCGTIDVEGGCFPARSTQGDIAVGSRVVVVGFDPSWLLVQETVPISQAGTIRSSKESIQAITTDQPAPAKRPRG
jgi:membrane-bound ClpP family serine protease